MAVLARAEGTPPEYAALVAARLTAWSDLTPKRTWRGLEFRVNGRRIVRMSKGRTAELRLTAPVIDRWESVLTECEQVSTGERDGWITVRIANRTDAELFLALVSVALKATLKSPAAASRGSKWRAVRRMRRTPRPPRP
ncbi:luciferase family protein [Spongiactinospora sp. 9N601]|uniref:luciferase domain-containing protein n=1 Tax=Spongiactinospora sp. 9N601 TaxID=3375149 RepID=UPI00379AD05E